MSDPLSRDVARRRGEKIPTLSLATGESPHVVVARAQVKAIEQVTGKLTKLSPGGFGWFHIKQAVKNLKQAQEELYNLIEESSDQP